MIYPKYRRKMLLPTRSAYIELEKLSLDLFNVQEVLEDGYDCHRSKREKGKIEKCLKTGKKAIRIVIAEGDFQYPDGKVVKVYWVIHASKETFKKRRK